jgi:hypothetical protein
MELTFSQDRQQLLHEEKRRADVHGKEPVKVLHRCFRDRRRLRNSGIRDKNVQPIANYGPNMPGQLVRPVRFRKVRRNSLSTSAGLADLGHDGFGLLGAAAVMDQNLRLHPSKSDRACAAYPARCAGDESSLAGETGHDLASF